MDRTSWSGAELLGATFPEPRWAVPGILSGGLAILAGRPKLGKSILALQLAIAVDAGGIFLGRHIERGRAAYLALEDAPRRIQGRLRQMGATPSCDVRFELDWPRIDHGGLAQLERAIAEWQARLVVIDTISRAMSGCIDWGRVGPVTAALGSIQDIAKASDTCILLIDHHRKPGVSGANVVDDVMESTGKTGVADTILGFYRERGQHTATLQMVGRDIDDQQLALRLDRATLCWQLAAGSGVQSAIVEALEVLGSATLTELASHLGKDKGNLSRELAELESKALIGRRSDSRTAPWTLLQRSQQAQLEVSYC